ncbi:MAG: aldo/keto reductase [bacterium]|nr:aldo/keto reductase [bacterium]
MTLRPFGKTALSVSPLGLGMAALGRPGYINLGHAGDLKRDYDPGAMEAHAHAVLDEAWALGIRYYDAARSYGEGERFLGNWLRRRDISPDKVVAGSKWGYTYTADWQVQAEQHEVKDHTLPTLQRQWSESQSALGGYLRLYQIHSATFDSGVLENSAVLHELARLKRDGLLIGLSLSGADQGEVLRKALTVEIDGVRLFDSVQVTWNALETAATDALKDAYQAGMGIIVKEALANGRLTTRNTDPAFVRKMAVLQRQAKRLNTSIDALALAFVLAQPWAAVVLSGAATLDQLRSNVQAVEVHLDEEAHAQLASLAEPAADYWNTRKRLAWN